MAQTTTPCPRCGGQMMVEVQQIFDVGIDPMDKERLLRGVTNIAACPSCGYNSAVAMPLVYHDPDKELLLTYFPAEMNLPLPEQEKILGPLISRVVNQLPPEKKKGYLFQPRSMLTYDTLMETILEADGITKEMLNEQKYKTDLLRRLVNASPDSLPEIIRQEEAHIDQGFFLLFNNTRDAAIQMRDSAGLERLGAIQKILLEETAYGRELKVRAESTQKAITDLQNLGENLNRDSLLELVVNSADATYLETLTGLARNGMDYEFFSKLSARVETVEGTEKDRLTQIRDTLLALTREIDAALEEERALRRQLLDRILAQEDMESAVMQVAQAIDQTFLDSAQEALNEARKSGDFMRSGKIQQLLDIIQKLSQPPAEVELMEKMLAAESDEELRALIEATPEMNTAEMKNLVATLIETGKARDSFTDEMFSRLERIRSILGA